MSVCIYFTKPAKPSKPFIESGKHANRLLPSGKAVAVPLKQDNSFASFVGFVIIEFVLKSVRRVGLCPRGRGSG
jgi:hypothetical protein